jgi:topoisomerase-4 subunit A
VSQLPSARGDGAPITTFVELEPGTRCEHVLAAAADTGVLLSTRGGLGFLCRAGDLVGRTRQGKSFLSVDAGDEPIRPSLVSAEMAQVLCVSGGGRALVLALDEIKTLRNGGRGVILMGLDPKEQLCQALAFGAAGAIVEGTGRGGKAIRREMSARELGGYAGARARKGRLLEPRVRDARLSLPRPESGA